MRKPEDAPDIADVKRFWERNPLCASGISHPVGSPDFFREFDKLREANESPAFLESLHEFGHFAEKKVLDVGAGNGFVLSRYAAMGAGVFGIDVTETAVNVCRKRFELSSLHGNFMVADAESLPFPDESFDLVTSMGVLHHTPNTAKAVSEIYRTLKPGGMAILMFYHRNSILYRLTFAIASARTGKSMEQLVNEVDGFGNPKGDVYSRAELARLLTGFTDIKMFAGLLQRWMLPMRDSLSRLLPDSALSAMEHRWGWFLYAKAVKPLS